MSRLARTGRLNPSRETKFSGTYGDRGIFIFSVQLPHEQDWQPYPVDPYSATCDGHTYINTTTIGGCVFLLSVCFCLCSLFYRDDVLAGYFLPVLFCMLSMLISDSRLIWFGSVYLVTTAGFVADQLM